MVRKGMLAMLANSGNGLGNCALLSFFVLMHSVDATNVIFILAISPFECLSVSLICLILNKIVSSNYCWKRWKDLEGEPFHITFTFARISFLMFSNRRATLLLGLERST